MYADGAMQVYSKAFSASRNAEKVFQNKLTQFHKLVRDSISMFAAYLPREGFLMEVWEDALRAMVAVQSRVQLEGFSIALLGEEQRRLFCSSHAFNMAPHYP